MTTGMFVRLAYRGGGNGLEVLTQRMNFEGRRLACCCHHPTSPFRLLFSVVVKIFRALCLWLRLRAILVRNIDNVWSD